MSSFAPRFTITNAITAGLTVIERARGFLEADTLLEEWARRMSQRTLWCSRWPGTPWSWCE
jgi:uncharacterized NAD-dependent epimerase/dehydratase family protein